MLLPAWWERPSRGSVHRKNGIASVDGVRESLPHHQIWHGLMQQWLYRTNYQLALGIWCTGLFCFYSTVTNPHGFVGMTRSAQGILLLVMIVCAGPIGWGLVKLAPSTKWVLGGLLICQTALMVQKAVLHPTVKAVGLALVGCWFIWELIRWDITGRIETIQLYVQGLKYVKHKSKPKSIWSTLWPRNKEAQNRSASGVDRPRHLLRRVDRNCC